MLYQYEVGSKSTLDQSNVTLVLRHREVIYSVFLVVLSIKVCDNIFSVLGCNSLAENHTYFVVGFVSQSNVSGDPRFILFTPGVQLDKNVDSLGQQVSLARKILYACRIK